MATFLDNKKRLWSIEFTLGSIARVKAETGLDLLTLHNPHSPALAVIRDDVFKLLQVLLVQLRPQLRDKGVGDEEFADSLHEEHSWDAVAALLTGMVDYYPPEKRAALKPLVETVLSAAANVRNRNLRAIQQTMANSDLKELQQEIEAGIERSISGNSTGNSPASSDSTRNP